MTDVPEDSSSAVPDREPGPVGAQAGTGWWASVRRWATRRRLVQAALLVGLGYVAIPLVSETPAVAHALRYANPWWLLVAVAFTVAGFFSAALALRACAGARLPFRDGVEMQVAASFTGTATPASVGSLALGVRFLTRNGQSATVAAAVVALQNLVQLLVHLVLLALLALVGGRGVDVLKDAPSGHVVLVVLGAVLVVVGVTLGVPRIRGTLAELWRSRGREAAVHLRGLLRSPRRLTASVLGAAGGTLSSAGTLWAVLIAVGGGDHPVVAAFTTMVGATLASAAPTPGGIGAVEAALVAGLTAFGVNPGTALAAAFGYRIINTWLPTGVGSVLYHRMEHRGAI
ncbi:lysylphosphatidylglycerol synthase transmembrane domain-containing protein [Cellulomonas hominis]